MRLLVAILLTGISFAQQQHPNATTSAGRTEIISTNNDAISFAPLTDTSHEFGSGLTVYPDWFLTIDVFITEHNGTNLLHVFQVKNRDSNDEDIHCESRLPFVALTMQDGTKKVAIGYIANNIKNWFTAEYTPNTWQTVTASQHYNGSHFIITAAFDNQTFGPIINESPRVYRNARGTQWSGNPSENFVMTGLYRNLNYTSVDADRATVSDCDIRNATVICSAGDLKIELTQCHDASELFVLNPTNMTSRTGVDNLKVQSGGSNKECGEISITIESNHSRFGLF